MRGLIKKRHIGGARAPEHMHFAKMHIHKCAHNTYDWYTTRTHTHIRPCARAPAKWVSSRQRSITTHDAFAIISALRVYISFCIYICAAPLVLYRALRVYTIWITSKSKCVKFTMHTYYIMRTKRTQCRELVHFGVAYTCVYVSSRCCNWCEVRREGQSDELHILSCHVC